MPKIVQVIGGAALIAVGAIATFTGAFPAGSLIAKLGISLFATGISISLGGIVRYLQKVPALSRTVSSKQGAAPWPIIYGTCQVGGVYTFWNTTKGNTGISNGQIDVVITLAGHVLNKIKLLVLDNVNIQDDGDPASTGIGFGQGAYFGSLLLERYMGGPTETPGAGHSFFPILDQATGGLWEATHLQRGRAGVHLQLKLKANGKDFSKLYPNGLPNPSFWVEGKSDIYDPRTMLRGYSSNPALIWADYLTQPDFGPKPAIDYLTGIDQDQLIAAANECDELVDLDGAPIFVGTGTGSARIISIAGIYTGTDEPVVLDIAINKVAGQDGAGPEDTFYWRMNYGPWNRGDQITDGPFSGTYPGIPITGSSQELVGLTQNSQVDSVDTGIAITFPVTTTHIPGDNWSVTFSGTYGSTPVQQHRYTCDGTFTTDMQPGDILTQIMATMAAKMVKANGKYFIYPGGYRTPYAFHDGATALTEKDILGNLKVSYGRTQRELYNGVKGTYYSGELIDFPPITGEGWWRASHPYVLGESFRDTNNHIQKVTTAGTSGSSLPVFSTSGGTTADGVGSLVWTDEGTGAALWQPKDSNNWLAIDGNVRVWSNIILAHSYSWQTCQRLGKIYLENNRRQIVVTGDFVIKAYQLQCTDTVRLTLVDYGWNNKTFEVVSVKLKRIKDSNGNAYVCVNLTLNETDVDVYGWTVTEEVRPAVQPPSLIQPQQPIGVPSATPLPWQPATSPAHGTFYSDPYDLSVGSTFNIQNVAYRDNRDGSISTVIQIQGEHPVTSLANIPPPIIGTVIITPTGGQLTAGKTLYVDLCAIDSEGRLSGQSFSAAIVLPAGANTYQFTLQDLVWDPNTVDWMIFIGESPYQKGFLGQGSLGFITYTGPLTAPTTITVLGDSSNYPYLGVPAVSLGEPDASLLCLRPKLKTVPHGGVYGTRVISVTSSTITVDMFDGDWSTVDWSGRFLTLVGRVNSGPMSIVDFKIGSNDTAGMLTLAAGQPDPTTVNGGLVLGDTVIIRTSVTSSGTDSTGDWIEDDLFGATGIQLITGSAEVGRQIRWVKSANGNKGLTGRIITGSGTNPTTRFYFAKGTFPNAVANGDCFIIEEQGWSLGAYDQSPAPNAAFFHIINMFLAAPNLASLLLLISVASVRTDGVESDDSLNPYRMLWIFGKGGTGPTPSVKEITPADPLTIDPADGGVQRLTLTGDILTSILLPGTYDAQEIRLDIYQDGAGGHQMNMPPQVRNGARYTISPGFPNAEKYAETVLVLSFRLSDSTWGVTSAIAPS